MIITFGGGAVGRQGADAVVTEAPAWAEALTVDTWTALSTTNTFEDVQASDVGQTGNTGPDTVFTSSCGAALIPELGDHGSILHCGAGHDDYFGNEVYRFDLSTLTWTRINEPSTADGGDWTAPKTNGILSDGTPFLPHTYYFLVGRDGKLVLGIRQTDNGPAYVAMPSIFDPVAETWTNSTESPTGIPSSFDARKIVYDSTRDLIWLIEPDPLSWASWDPDTDTWTSYDSAQSAYGARNAAVYVPTKDCVILFAESPGTQVVGLDPANPTDPGNNEVLVTTSGTAPAFTNASMAHWSSNLGAIVYYVSRGDTIHTLTPPEGDWTTDAWVWAERTLTGTSGVHDGSAGTYGKFQVVEWGAITVATVIGDVDGAYQAVRLV